MHCHTLVLSIQHFFRTRISHTPLTIQLPKLECGCTPWNEFLIRNPCLCTRLVDFTTVLFFLGVDQALLFSQSCSFRPDNGLNIFCCELTSTVQTLGALIIMESFDDDVYSIRARAQCVPLKLLVCTLFLSSLIATHSCKCILRVFAKSREASIQTYWCPSKDIPLHATVSFQKAKKNLNFFLDAINLSQCSK